jgi:nitrogenase molybdenum-iron protein alpha/beta subunit
MTPKEKAEELILKFMKLQEPNYNWFHSKLAKQCAIIAINEIIDALETYDDMTEKHLKREFPNYLSCELQNMEQDFRYYQKVKQEIEKL